MGLDTDIRVLWPHTAASIPASWSRDTDFDEKFLQGSATAGSTGGVTEHTHTPGSHVHTGIAHNHSTPSAFGSTGTVIASGSGGPDVSNDGHTHPATVTTAHALTYSNETITINTDTGLPPYIKAIIIKPNDGNQEVPVNGVVFFAKTAAPTNFYRTDGGNGTVDMSDRFVLGADNGGDGGATGGSITHTHISPADTHTTGVHNHPQSNYSDASSTTTRGSTRNVFGVYINHHKQNTANASGETTSSVAVVLDVTSSEPAFTRLLAIQNKGGAASTPDDVICPFVGSTAPSGWLVCDGTNGTPDLSTSQIKITVNSGNICTTGGSDSPHVHTDSPHIHVHTSSHLHTFSLSPYAAVKVQSGALILIASSGHGHLLSGGQTGTTLPAMLSATVSIGSTDGKYSYRTVKFIQKKELPSVHLCGGAIKGATLAGL